MAGIFENAFQERKQGDLGKELQSWMYMPQKSNKFLYYILGFVFATVIFLFTYGSHLVPWLKKVPDYAVYIIFLLFGPAVNLMRSMGKNREYSLFENGFIIRYVDKNKNNKKNEQVGYWRDYKSADYSGDQVTLIPSASIRRKIKLKATQNVMQIFSLCRERISIAQTENLQLLMRRPTTPNTPEQRRAARMEQQSRHRPRAYSWPKSF